jgi:hypothetical protein
VLVINDCARKPPLGPGLVTGKLSDLAGLSFVPVARGDLELVQLRVSDLEIRHPEARLLATEPVGVCDPFGSRISAGHLISGRRRR